MSDSRQMEFPFHELSAEGSPAKTLASQGRTAASPEKGPDSGRRCFDSSEMYGRRGRLLKMYRPFDLEGLPWSFKISPRSGIALNGTAYPLVPLVPLTRGIDSGLWPTPVSRDWKDGTAEACKNVLDRPRSRPLGREVHFRGNYQSSGSLNPEWVEWLMGFPAGWTDLDN